MVAHLFPSMSKTNEPGHEKMCLMSYANNKGADQPANPRSLISAFVVRCLHVDSIISLDSIAEISRLKLAYVAAQAGLCLPWSEISEDTFCRVVAQMIGLIRRHCFLHVVQMHEKKTTRVHVSDWSSKISGDIVSFMWCRCMRRKLLGYTFLTEVVRYQETLFPSCGADAWEENYSGTRFWLK